LDTALRWLTFAATLQATCMTVTKQAPDRLGF
jgi:hypothetical protein